MSDVAQECISGGETVFKRILVPHLAVPISRMCRLYLYLPCCSHLLRVTTKSPRNAIPTSTTIRTILGHRESGREGVRAKGGLDRRVQRLLGLEVPLHVAHVRRPQLDDDGRLAVVRVDLL